MLVQHHTKYIELHGKDEIVMMEKGDHRKLHNRLRKEGLCGVSPAELNIISTAAHGRSDKCKAKKVAYQKKNRQKFDFYDTLMPNVRHRELIDYNHSTGNVCVYCAFRPHNGKKLFYLDIRA